MYHTNRVHTVKGVNNILELTDYLANYTWCRCNGFEYKGYLFLNDATSEDGAQEYAIFKKGNPTQIESITFSWCDFIEAITDIYEIISGGADNFNMGERYKGYHLDNSERHHCYLCA